VPLAYPIGDVVVATMLVVLAAGGTSAGQRTLALLSCGLGGIAVSDSTVVYLLSTNRLSEGNWVDTGWLMGCLLIGLAALSARSRPIEPPSPNAEAPRARLLSPYLPVCVAVVMAVGDEFNGGLSDVIFLTLVALIGLVVARQSLALSEIRRLSVRERQLEHQASHDSLTDLANWAYFRRRLSRALGDASEAPMGTVAVLFVDLDDFKDVNDRLGHPAGDRLLIAVADRLRGCIRPTDTAARLGGDEFGVLVAGAPGTREVTLIAERILEALHIPIWLGPELSIAPRASIGLAVADSPAVGTDELLRRADLAMYAAKSRGKGTMGIFEPSLEAALLCPASPMRPRLEPAAG
jgi:diguanylate cyclase (GGDEF)-like protein